MGNSLGVGGVPPRADLRKYRYTDAQKEEVLRLVDAGHTYRHAAGLINQHLSAGTVSRWVKERNDQLERERIAREYRILRGRRQATNRTHYRV